MGKVILDMAMSLDGYICGPNDEDGGLHDWYFTPSDTSRAIIDELVANVGAIVMGRRSYEMGDQFDGFVDNIYKVPHLILTHHPPQTKTKGETEFIFITDGIENLMKQAQAAAGEKNVIIGGGANTTYQFLEAGLIDELHIHLVPVVFGTGKALFPAGAAIQLENIMALESAGVTHLRYRVIN
jgi:dihydrofolate reductase